MTGRQATWTQLDGMVGDGGGRQRHAATASRLASLYRSVCADLMTAQTRGYAPDLVDYLDGLAARASSALYGPRRRAGQGLFRLLWVRFPVTLRKQWRFFLVANLLFYVPLAAGLVGTLYSQAFAEQILPSSQLAMMAQMYENGYEAGRSGALDTMMFGHYVQNNIGIAFRCFATGILLGLGSLYFLLYNGLIIGTTVGYVITAGGGSNILTFICGHGPFELTAIVVSGGAGLQMGWALIDPGGQTRWGSLRSQGRELVDLVAGAGAMLAVAAVLEGFWSPSSLPPQVKWAASALFTSLLIAFFAVGGRGSPEADAPHAEVS